MLSGLAGGAWGGLPRSRADLEEWSDFAFAYGLHDLPAFVEVATIHNAGYLGGLIGLVAAVGFLLVAKRRKAGESDPG